MQIECYPHKDRLQYAFFGKKPSLTGTVISVGSNCTLTHVGICVTLVSEMYLPRHGVIVPPGQYLVHSSISDYPTSVGGYTKGVVITPIMDIMRAYDGGYILWLYCVQPSSDETFAQFVEYVDNHLGDPYGIGSLVNVVVIVNGDLPDHTPICSTFVDAWLTCAGYFSRTRYESPGGLYHRMLQSGHFKTDSANRIDMPVDIVVFVVTIMVVAFLLFLLSTWRPRPI